MGTDKLDSILDRWNTNPDFLIEILQDVQDEFRHLPEDAMREVADRLGVPLKQLYHAATFYKAFSLEERGKREVQVCTGTACHVRGSGRVLEAFGRELEIEPGETTTDKEYTLEAVRCVGCCGLAPAVVVGDDIHSTVRPDKVAKLIAKYGRAGS